MSAKTKIVVLHMKELIYTAIFVGLGILLIMLLLFMFLPKKEKDKSVETMKYVAGVYTSSILFHDSTLDVQVIVDENRINSISLVNLNETVTTMYPLVEPALEEVSDQIIKTQSVENISYQADNQYTTDTLCQGCLRNFFALFKLFCTIIQNKPLNLIGHRFLARFAEMQLDTIGCLSNPLYHNGLLCTLCGQRGSGRGGGAGVGFVAHRFSFQR